ncbi:MAG: toprim domain-containing protein [Patescibacteria group bacterium]
MNLVIVESPTKAKTISKFLNKDFVIKASIGHVRDLPKSKMGVDIAKDFEPQYEISKDKTKVVKELKQLSKESDEIYFATDEDREGEAITWLIF